LKLRNITLGILSALLLLSTAAGAASAVTFLGPNFAVGNIPVGGTAQINLSVGSGSSISSYPFCSTPGASSCNFNVCPAVSNPAILGGAQFEFYGIREAFVTTPNGDQYQMGSATRIFMADSSTMDGIGPVPMSPGGYAPQLTLGKDDSFNVPFGPSLAYPLSFTSVDSGTWLPALSAYTTNPEAGYFWWRTQVGGAAVSPQRVDVNPTPALTGQAGTYHIDIEGNVFCSNGVTVPFSIDNFFDIGNIVFTATTSSTSSTSHSTIGAPQFAGSGSFPLGMTAVIALALVALAAVKKRNLGFPVR
jgi:hypothetical protein